jgi:hypothetical protein
VTNLVSRASLAAVAVLAFSRAVAGQAWVPPAGVGSVNLTYQTIANAGHRATEGTQINDGKSTNIGVAFELEYALTDRLSLSGAVPFVFSKYVGPHGPPPPIPYLPIDSCMCWHSGWQDFAFTARYNLFNSAFGLTPSISLGVPSHDYDFRGEATLGSDLKELRFGVDAGRRLDAISPKLSVQGRYSYAVVERALDIGHNRSTAAGEAGYLVTRRLSARGFVSWQHTHGGLRFGSFTPGAALQFPGEVNTPERLFQHDRLLKDNNWRTGGGVAYSLPQFDVFGSYINYTGGTDSHAGHVFTVGVSWPFEVDRRAKQP